MWTCDGVSEGIDGTESGYSNEMKMLSPVIRTLIRFDNSRELRADSSE